MSAQASCKIRRSDGEPIRRWCGATDYHDLTEQISSIVEGDVLKTPMKYWITLAITDRSPDCWA